MTEEENNLLNSRLTHTQLRVRVQIQATINSLTTRYFNKINFKKLSVNLIKFLKKLKLEIKIFFNQSHNFYNKSTGTHR